MKCLVGYMSKSGSTAEIAQRIGSVLEARGVDVEVKPLLTVGNIRDYDRLVLGCPVNGMNVLPEFRAYLSDKVVGSGIPLDLFMVSYLFEKGRKVFRKVIAKNREIVRDLAKASSIEVFGGRLPAPLPPAMRFMFGTPSDLPLDIRDWDKIEAWAGKLADDMKP